MFSMHSSHQHLRTVVHVALAVEVPQPRDWLLVCRAIWSPVSFRRAALFHATAEYCRRSADRCKDPEPRALASMMRCMASVERSRIQRLLRKASAINVLMDDRKGWTLIRARVSYVNETSGTIDSSLLFVAAVRRGGMVDKDLMDFDEDHGARIVSATDAALRRLCTQDDGTLDEVALRQVYARVMTMCADGGPKEVKALKCFNQLFPSISLLIRDACHAIRLACKEPLSHLRVLSTLLAGLLIRALYQKQLFIYSLVMLALLIFD